MKKLFTLFNIIILSFNINAQSPQKISYQCVIRNTGGVLVTNQSVGMRISILKDSPSGAAVYVETQTSSTNSNGLLTLEIGGGNVVSGSIATIDWSDGTYFIKTETDPAGGTSYTITGTSQILSVPYALHAKTAETTDYNDLTNKPLLFDGTWGSLTGKPTTISGLGITDFDLSGATTDDLLRYNGTKWVAFTPGYLTAGSGQYYYADRDNDGYGSKMYPVWIPTGVTPPEGFIINSDDCDDNNPAINPGAVEVCNDGADNNCNGLTDCDDGDCTGSISCTPVDIVFLIDNTGDMGGEVANLQTNLSTIISQLSATIPDMAIGIATYQDFPYDPYGAITDKPYILRTALTTDFTAVQSALNSVAVSGGGDMPESGNEAFYQLATGSGISGIWGTIAPSVMGFRTGSHRIVVVITSAEFHNATDYPFTTHGKAEAFSALSSIDAKAIGINTGTSANARSNLEDYAIQTGATMQPTAGSGTCPTGLNGTANSPVNGVCPLVYDISSDGTGIATSIVNGIMSLISQ
jgi:hypothetical protein